MSADQVAKSTVDAKRSYDSEPVQFDWHDYLAIVREAGKSYGLGDRFRFRRKDTRSPGLELECTQAGRTGGREPIWPSTENVEVADGSAKFTTRALSGASLISTITSSDFPLVDGVTLSAPSDNDLVYTIFVAGGVDGQDYEIRHRVVLSGSAAQQKEMVAILPVRD